MIKTRAFLLGLSAVFLTPSVWAAGFQLNEFSVAAQGRANAGEPAMADTAAAIARNSAVMNNFEKASISIDYHYIDPEVDVKGYNTAPIYKAEKKDIAPSASVPSLYYVQPLNDKVAVGVSLNSYFGLSTDFEDSFMASEIANKTSIKTYYVTPHVSFKASDSLSLGLGISYVYGEGEIRNTASAVLGGAGIAQGTPLLDLKGEGYAFGYTLGLLWNADENTRVGFSYRSRVDLELKGKVTMYVPNIPVPPNGPGLLLSHGEMTLNLPETYELGLAHDFADKFTLMAGVQKTGWHRFKELKGDIKGAGEVTFKQERWQDAYRISVGGEWHAIDALTLRLGVGYDESPVQSDYRALSIPDANRSWWTLGSTIKLGDAGSLDLAFSYLRGDKVSMSEKSKVGTTFNGKLTKTNAYIYSVGYNVSF